MLSRYPSLFLLSALISFAPGYTSGNAEESLNELVSRDVGDLCTVVTPRTTLLGDRIFFMSGDYTFLSSSSTKPIKTQSLYWLDLNDTFAVDSTIPAPILRSTQVPLDVSPNIGLQLNGSGGSFFTDNDTLYAYSGFAALTDDESNNILPSYNINTGKWKAVSVVGGNLQFGDRYKGLSAEVPELGLSYYLGGDFNSPTPGMTRFNSSDASWVNQTTSGVPNILSGAMVHIPVGDQGILVAFGGYNTAIKAQPNPNGQIYELAPMNQIYVYDIRSSNWYTVTATGKIPGGTSDFCAAVSASPDKSSFQITMYGGWAISGQRAYEDTYVLAVPSFRWIKIQDNSNTEYQPSTPQIGRRAHKCVMWQDSQLVVIGGIVQNGITQLNNASTCRVYLPLRVLDTSTFTWQAQFEPGKKYSVPSQIYSVVGGNSGGKANLTQPDGGWPDPYLKTIFSKTVTSSSVPSNTTAGTSPPPTKKSNAGAIAGGVVGGLAAIALIGLALTWFLRHRSRPQNVVTEEEVGSWRKSELPGSAVEARGEASPVGKKYEPYEIGREPEPETRFELAGDSGASEMAAGRPRTPPKVAPSLT